MARPVVRGELIPTSCARWGVRGERARSEGTRGEGARVRDMVRQTAHGCDDASFPFARPPCADPYYGVDWLDGVRTDEIRHFLSWWPSFSLSLPRSMHGILPFRPGARGGEPLPFDRVISLGGACEVAYQLRRMIRFGRAYSFDGWILPLPAAPWRSGASRCRCRPCLRRRAAASGAELWRCSGAVFAAGGHHPSA